MPSEATRVHNAQDAFKIRRAVPALGLWQGDIVRVTDAGGLELVRSLPPGAVAVLRRAEVRGDVHTNEEDANGHA
jgi:hypothetical protein